MSENGKQVASLGGSIWVADKSGAWSDFSYQGEDQIKLVPDKKSYKVGETAHVLANNDTLPGKEATDLSEIVNDDRRGSEATGRTVWSRT